MNSQPKGTQRHRATAKLYGQAPYCAPLSDPSQNIPTSIYLQNATPFEFQTFSFPWWNIKVVLVLLGELGKFQIPFPSQCMGHFYCITLWVMLGNCSNTHDTFGTVSNIYMDSCLAFWWAVLASYTTGQLNLIILMRFWCLSPKWCLTMVYVTMLNCSHCSGQTNINISWDLNLLEIALGLFHLG